MGDESTKRAAQEYLAAKLSEEGQSFEDKANREAAISLAQTVWKSVVQTVIEKCTEWNVVTREQTLTCKETLLGDLRIRCAGRSPLVTVHFNSRKLLVTIDNTARLEHEPVTVLSIEGYAMDSGRSARLMRNNLPVNLDMMILGHLRVLAGLTRRTND